MSKKSKTTKIEEQTEWIATIRCTVKKSVVLSGCTEEQATNDPWQYAIQETETYMSDWDVERVEPNT